MAAVQQFPMEKEYEKNPDITPEDISRMREWLRAQPHLPGDRITDLDLMLVLFCCNRSTQVSQKVLDLHFTARTLFRQFFQVRKVDKAVEDCLNTILFAVLPTPTVHGYRAIYIRLLNADPKKFFYNDSIRTFMMLFDLWQYEEGTWPGLVFIVDMDQSCIGHLARVDLMSLKQALYFLQECMLVKLREVHFINAPSFMDKLMMMMRPFMKKQLMDLIRIHQVGADTLYEYVPKIALPKEEGGEYKDHITLRDEVIQRFRVNEKLMEADSMRRVDESKRPGGAPQTLETLFGIQGSFKKLDID